MEKTYNYILLDWDGCLAKTLDVWLKAYKFVVEKRGIKITDDSDFVEKTFGKWHGGFENVGIKDTKEAYDEALDIVEEEITKVELYPNAKNLLETLKNRNKKLAIVTSSFEHLVIPALKYNDVYKYFDSIITFETTKKVKPDRWIVDKSLENLNGSHNEAIIMGDSDHDVLTGHNANISSVLFYPEHNKKFYKEEFLLKHNPDYIIKDHIELLDIIK